METGIIVVSLVHILIGLLLIFKDKVFLDLIQNNLSPHLRSEGNKEYKIRSIIRAIGWIFIILGIIWFFLLGWIVDITGR